MYDIVHLLEKTYMISKSYGKIHENLQVTNKIMKIIQILTYEYN